jgi:hypothetical protein
LKYAVIAFLAACSSAPREPPVAPPPPDSVMCVTVVPSACHSLREACGETQRVAALVEAWCSPGKVAP